MKKANLIIKIVALLVIIWVIGSGFVERTDVYLFDYSVAGDGESITLRVGIAGSMGYTRGFKDNGGGVKPHYLTFYSTFGGFNSTICADDEYDLMLDPEDREIWFNRGDGGYELILQRDEVTGQWERP